MAAFQPLQRQLSSYNQSRYATPLAALGGIWASYQLLKVASFTWLHFLRPSSLPRYQKTSGKNDGSWAIVTGASDGIGKAFAEELADRGFNVVLHGRNEKKLQGVRQDLERRWPEMKFRLLILDAVEDVSDYAKMEAAVDDLKTLNVKVLINNVGGNANSGPLLTNAQDQSGKMVDTWIDCSVTFTAQITRLLLPQLIKQQPALIISIGSGVSQVATPWLSIYSGCKAFLIAWSRSLQVELRGLGHDIECMTMLVGGVATERSERPASLSEPTPRRLAKASLDVVGSGYREVWAYWMHHLFFGVVTSFPTSVGEALLLGIARDMKAKEEKGLKAL